MAKKKTQAVKQTPKAPSYASIVKAMQQKPQNSKLYVQRIEGKSTFKLVVGGKQVQTTEANYKKIMGEPGINKVERLKSASQVKLEYSFLKEQEVGELDRNKIG